MVRNAFHVFLLLGIGLWSNNQMQAHTVVWWENPLGNSPSNTLAFAPDEFYAYVKVLPTYLEPCTVVVNLNQQASTLISAQVLPPNPANKVWIRVLVLRPPVNHFETATLSGEWHATGLPVGYGCTATNPNPFTVPISVTDQELRFQIGLSINQQSVKLDSGYYSALLAGSCVTGPFRDIGVGTSFSLPLDMPMKFFQRSKPIGNLLGGIITDPMGNLLSGIQLSLPYGGLSATSDSTGTYIFPWLPYGINALNLTNPIGASLNLEVTNTDDTVMDFKVDMEADPPVTNACNCTPWCAIGFGSAPGGQTPVYYAGGANPPASGVPNCDTAVVTVTPPSGPAFTITAGSNHHQNSGPNPASGTWTISTTVCSQTKTASVTVP